MFTNKENVNILTALLLRHGVTTAVVCPGSRNAPIVHNFHEAGMRCIAITDERSAGFYALGLSLAYDRPVAVCVTSGTALLNLAPAVAEATYQRRGIIAISADRPAQWIGQLDGQTMPQQNALGTFVSKSVTLPEPSSDEERAYCERLVNEALLEVQGRGHESVHINVPISEPLFEFTTTDLPKVKTIRRHISRETSQGALNEMFAAISNAKRPVTVVGQYPYSPEFQEAIDALCKQMTVFQEPLSPGTKYRPFDEVLSVIEESPDYMPDLIIHVGGNIVSKHLKKFLRAAKNAKTWRIDETGEICDTFGTLTNVIEGNAVTILRGIANESPMLINSEETFQFYFQWSSAFNAGEYNLSREFPTYSESGAVHIFESQLKKVNFAYRVHYANSTAVRLGNLYSTHYIYVNRGINGIEGSLSTAAGFSMGCKDRVFCVIGDLSFFYDSNALWNNKLGGNFRILLINNGGGGIFRSLPGLEKSRACHTYISGSHHTSAKSICEAHNVEYLCVEKFDTMKHEIKRLITANSVRPMLLEIFV